MEYEQVSVIAGTVITVLGFLYGIYRDYKNNDKLKEEKREIANRERNLKLDRIIETIQNEIIHLSDKTHRIEAELNNLKLNRRNRKNA